MKEKNREVRTDCHLYDQEKVCCRGLNDLYCKKEDCKFYKPRNAEKAAKA